jgi:tetratricopeptide (TPR) repeat protein
MDMKTTEEIYEQACEMAADNHFEEALNLLEPLIQAIPDFSLPTDTVWMDFNSYLDSLVYQDYYANQIGDRQIGRHPMKPARILFLYGGLLIELGQAEEAILPLRMLVSFDPVCPKYLFELGEAYKRTRQIREAYDNALWAVSCASNPSELARCYRDLGYSLSEQSAFEDAMMLNLLSLHFEPSRHAETEIAWIREKTGISPDGFDLETIMNRCEELEIPVGISSTVINNIEFLKSLNLSAD